MSLKRFQWYNSRLDILGFELTPARRRAAPRPTEFALLLPLSTTPRERKRGALVTSTSKSNFCSTFDLITRRCLYHSRSRAYQYRYFFFPRCRLAASFLAGDRLLCQAAVAKSLHLHTPSRNVARSPIFKTATAPKFAPTVSLKSPRLTLSPMSPSRNPRAAPPLCKAASLAKTPATPTQSTPMPSGVWAVANAITLKKSVAKVNKNYKAYIHESPSPMLKSSRRPCPFGAWLPTTISPLDVHFLRLSALVCTLHVVGVQTMKFS